jgi:hypothetical protein
VIVHCMAASGCKLFDSRTRKADSSAAPTADKCVELNIEADPNGDRTMSKLIAFTHLEYQLISSRHDQGGSDRGS